jgi:hypothetical protein
MLDGNNQYEAFGGLIPQRERLASILARDPVDHCEVRIGALLDDPATELGFLVRVVHCDNGQSDPRIAPRVLGLERARAGANEDGVALKVDPHRIDVRRPIAHQCCEVAEVGSTEKCLDLLRELVCLVSLSHMASFAMVVRALTSAGEPLIAHPELHR